MNDAAHRRTDENSAIISKIMVFIEERRYQPTERLPSERDLAERFHTSRGAVREALAALESMRVVERRPNSGIYLRKPDETSIEALVLQAQSGLPFQPEEIESVFEVRRILEVQAVRLACVRRTSEDIEALHEILIKTKKKIDKNNSIHAEDEDFHTRIISATKNEILLRIAKSLYAMSRERRRVYFSDPQTNERAYSDHVEILQAIEDRRVGQAERRMGDHLTQAAQTWRSLLSEAQSPRESAR